MVTITPLDTFGPSFGQLGLDFFTKCTLTTQCNDLVFSGGKLPYRFSKLSINPRVRGPHSVPLSNNIIPLLSQLFQCRLELLLVGQLLLQLVAQLVVPLFQQVPGPCHGFLLRLVRGVVGFNGVGGFLQACLQLITFQG